MSWRNVVIVWLREYEPERPHFENLCEHTTEEMDD